MSGKPRLSARSSRTYPSGAAAEIAITCAQMIGADWQRASQHDRRHSSGQPTSSSLLSMPASRLARVPCDLHALRGSRCERGLENLSAELESRRKQGIKGCVTCVARCTMRGLCCSMKLIPAAVQSRAMTSRRGARPWSVVVCLHANCSSRQMDELLQLRLRRRELERTLQRTLQASAALAGTSSQGKFTNHVGRHCAGVRRRPARACR